MRNNEEAQIVAAIKLTLELKGFLCQRVNQYRADKSGSDVVGDLLVSHPEWEEADWIMGEVKTATGRLSHRRPPMGRNSGYSQQDLFDMGRLLLWRNSDEALHDVERVHRKKMRRKGGKIETD